MIKLQNEIEKASIGTLWYLMGEVSEQLQTEVETNRGKVTENSKTAFWYELCRLLRDEIDKRMKQEG